MNNPRAGVSQLWGLAKINCKILNLGDFIMNYDKDDERGGYWVKK
jgi:hypothetical protein